MRFVRQISARLAEAIPVGRDRRLATGIASGVLVKGISFFLTSITVPLTLNYLGVERYGIWVTMISLLAWLGLMDLGIANGLTPALSAAFGKKRDDLARQYVATAVWSLLAIALAAGAIIAVVWGFIDWSGLFNVEGAGIIRELSLAMALAVTFFLMNLPLAVNQRILLAYQEGAAANLCQLLVSGAGLVGIYAVTRTEGGLVYLVLGYSGVQILVQLAISVWLFTSRKPELQPFVRPVLADAKHVLSLGGLFFVCQISTLLMYNKDNLLITHYLGPGEVAVYSVTWQLFLFLNAIGLIIAPYLGPSFGEAFVSGDRNWMRRAFGQYLKISLGFSVPAIVLLVLFHRQILSLWLGHDIEPTLATVVWLALWSLVQAALYPVVALLVGIGRLKRYAAWSIIAALGALLGSILLVQIYGVVGVISASVISYIFLLALPCYSEIMKVFENLGSAQVKVRWP